MTMNDALFETEQDTDITFYDNTAVELVQYVGNDAGIAAAARVSTGNDLNNTYTEEKNAGLINYLMKNRHGSPFEHNSMTFRITAPIFVIREFQRHRIGWSYNEVSGRYTIMEPEFYLTSDERPLVQEGTSAHPELALGSEDQQEIADSEMARISMMAWEAYTYMITAGVANEVARDILPLNLYSSMYATCNVRSLLNFLSIRVEDDISMFTTKPLYEIQEVALQMESHLEALFPATYAAFIKNGRVSP